MKMEFFDPDTGKPLDEDDTGFLEIAIPIFLRALDIPSEDVDEIEMEFVPKPKRVITVLITKLDGSVVSAIFHEDGRYSVANDTRH